MKHAIYHGDVMACMALMPDASQDACLTDAPYGLGADPVVAGIFPEIMAAWLAGRPYDVGGAGFMGKRWDSFVPGPEVWREVYRDSFVPGPEVWREVYRVLKPGASLMCFAGDRTEDLMALAIRLAGFEKIGTIPWIYGSGFPKSFDISAAIDKRLEVARTQGETRRHVVKLATAANGGFNDPARTTYTKTYPESVEARQWAGYGTRLKPCYEPCMWFMKPFKGGFAANALMHGVAGINVDGARIGDGGQARHPHPRGGGYSGGYAEIGPASTGVSEVGRWPSNIVLSPEVAGRLGSLVAPYFYCAKPDGDERDAGILGALRTAGELTDRTEGSAGLNSPRAGAGRRGGRRNIHPTVKPIDLTRYLATLLLPPAGRSRRLWVPFCGSGSEVIGGLLAGWDRVLGCDSDEDSVRIARERCAYWGRIYSPPSNPHTGERSLFDIAVVDN